ncbi:phosphatase PAP2 family protein [Alicyclobacillus ferrooxydans]|uniref:Inositolphosphotransferase Aur1/Ipt1 domain-containing protein n=1 Tax=Alicyclobacillus ferrooxydans TaxID=471514 RepID=A0A0P9GNP0_9BACL|nr:phosphatase PAP2 family protein [Alicyclobacillus ferrooxydans]KPV42088.1 hypothetical protein AN477_19335 [Alicyclobacillus ferrooxydans]
MLQIKRLVQLAFRLELFEVFGLVASFAATMIFLLSAHRLDDYYGIHAYASPIVNETVGVLESPMPWVFLGVVSILLGAYIRIRKQQPKNAPMRLYLIRVIIAFVVLMAIYKITNFYIAVYNPFDRDAAIQHIDRVLFFGKLPSEWMEPWVSRPLTWLFSAAYLSWFVLSYGTVLVMARRDREAIRQYMSMALSTFYIGYFTYFLVPVIGPVFTVPYATPIGGVDALFANTQALISRDCFPSLHTGIAIVMMVSVWRHHRRFSWFYIPITILIIFSTIYLRVHYALDVFAGTGLSIAMTQLSPQWVKGWAALHDWASGLATSPKHQPTVKERAFSELA